MSHIYLAKICALQRLLMIVPMQMLVVAREWCYQAGHERNQPGLDIMLCLHCSFANVDICFCSTATAGSGRDQRASVRIMHSRLGFTHMHAQPVIVCSSTNWFCPLVPALSISKAT